MTTKSKTAVYENLTDLYVTRKQYWSCHNLTRGKIKRMVIDAKFLKSSGNSQNHWNLLVN
jgi:hypothetical protein